MIMGLAGLESLHPLISESLVILGSLWKLPHKTIEIKQGCRTVKAFVWLQLVLYCSFLQFWFTDGFQVKQHCLTSMRINNHRAVACAVELCHEMTWECKVSHFWWIRSTRPLKLNGDFSKYPLLRYSSAVPINELNFVNDALKNYFRFCCQLCSLEPVSFGEIVLKWLINCL